MSLRDKLRVLSEGAEGVAAGELVSEWVGAVDSLFDEIRGFLAEYQTDNLLALTAERISLHEEGLGDYAITRLGIRSGKSLVRLTPAGRIVAGALGRIDLAKSDWPG
jgi:hypothetical protein